MAISGAGRWGRLFALGLPHLCRADLRVNAGSAGTRRSAFASARQSLSHRMISPSRAPYG
jgi:hypothetical protein